MSTERTKFNVFNGIILLLTILAITIFNYFQVKLVFLKLNCLNPEVNSKLINVAISSILIGIFTAIVLTVICIVFFNNKTKMDKGGEESNTNNSHIHTNVKNTNIVIETSKKLSEYTEEIGASVSEMASFTENQAAYVEQFSAALEELAKGIQQTSTNTQEAATHVGNVKNEIDLFVQSIEKITSVAQNLSDESQNAQSTAKNGEVVITDAINEMNNVSARIKDLVEYITTLGESTNEIGKILDVIKNIANQTNMLALNASIEAARAGEHGKGFSVVAKSIKELADKSKEATNGISDIIQNIQVAIKEAVNKSNNGLNGLESGMNLIKNTGDSMKEVLTVIDKTYKYSLSLTENTRMQEKSSKEILEGINGLNNIVQEISATAMEESAGVEEVFSGIETIKDNINELAAGDEELVTIFANFKKDANELGELINSKYKY